MLPLSTSNSAALPKIDNQNKVNVKGMIRVPSTNWRMVRPREMRAKNKPTHGADATHQAQEHSVQPVTQSARAWPGWSGLSVGKGRSKAKVLSVIAVKRLM